MAELKVSPAAEGTKAAEVPLLDHETRIRTLETTASAPTLHQLATREPTSFHLATIYNGLVRPNTPAWRRYGLLAASIGIVLLQCFVAGGFSIGVSMSSCSEISECGRGMYCEEGMCDWCEERHKSCCLPNATDTCAVREGRASKLDEKDRESMCAACTTSKGFETYPDIQRDRVDSMRLQDWLALFLASLVVAFAVFAEMRDAVLCHCALRDISQVPRGWRFAIGGLNFCRNFVFLPCVVLSVMELVLADGGRVRDVCLNTVAVLFLLEVDNMAFLHGLGERTRMEAEQYAHSGARVTEDDLQLMGVVKLVCVVLIPCTVLVGVCGHSWVPDEPDVLTLVLAPLPSIVVVFVQRVIASRSKLKGSCSGFGWAILNFSMYSAWNGLFYMVTYIQILGPRGIAVWLLEIAGLVALVALTLFISTRTSSSSATSTASSGSS